MEKLEGQLSLGLLEDIFTRLQQKEIVANLYISDGESERVVYISVGALRMLVFGPRRGLRFGEILVEAKMATEEDIQAALEDQKDPDKPPRLLGEILVEMGKLSKTKVDRVLGVQVKREFLDCFTWHEAIVRFVGGDPSPKLFDPERPVIKYSDDLPKFFSSLSQALAEHREVQASFRSVVDIPTLSEEWRRDDILRKHKGMTKKILEQVDGKSRIREIASASRITEHECMVALHRRVAAGEVTIEWARDAATVKRERDVVIAECERLERAVREMVEDRLARQRLALDYEFLGEHEKSAEQWSILIDREIELGHVDNALTALDKKIKIHPTDFEAHEKRINVAARGLRGDVAIKYGVELARLYAKYGFTNRAFGLYEKIIEWAPSNVEARRGFAELAREMGDRKVALEHLREVATHLEKDGAGEILEEVYSELIKLDTTDSAARSFLRNRAVAQLSWFRRRGPFVLCLFLILVSIGFVVVDTHARIELQAAARESRERFYAGSRDAALPLKRFKDKTVYSLTPAAKHARRLIGELGIARSRARNIQLSYLMWRVKNLDLPLNDVASAEKHLELIIAIGSDTTQGVKANDELQLILDNKSEVRRQWKRDVEAVLERVQFDPTDSAQGELAYTNARRILKAAPSWAYPIAPFIPRFVRSDPPGAEIFLNGRLIGPAPRFVEMPIDSPVELVLSLSGGYRNASRMVPADAPFEVNMLLERPIRWRLELDSCVTAPVTVVDGVAYCGTEDGLVAAVQTKTGKLFWATHPARPDKTPLFSAISYQPAVSAKYVVAATVYEGVFVLDRATGAVVRHLTDIQEISAPPVFSTDGSLCFLTGDDGYLYTYETLRFELRGGYLDLDSKVLGTPVFDSSYLLVCTFGGKCLVVDTELSSIVKSIDLDSPITFGPVHLRDRILAISHKGDTPILYAVKLATENPREPGTPEGVAVVTGKQDRMGRVSATPTYIPDVLYIPSTTGKVAAMSVGGPKVDVLWVESLGTGSVSMVSVAEIENFCYAVDGAGRLHAFNRTRGEVQWSTSAPTGFTSPPAVTPNGVLVCGDDAVLYMLEFN